MREAAGPLNKRVRIFARVHMVAGGIGLALGGLVIAAFALANDPAYEVIFYSFVAIFGGITFVWFLPSFIGGLSLLNGLPWARALFWVQAALLAPLVPVGTVLAGISLWVLVPRPDEVEDTKQRYFAFERALARSIRPALVALAALASLGAMIGLGYIFRDQIEALDPPPEQELTPLPVMPNFEDKRPKTPDFSSPSLPGSGH